MLDQAIEQKVSAMQAVFEVGLAVERDPHVHKNRLVREFEESLHWWLHTRPEVFHLHVFSYLLCLHSSC